MGAVDRMDSVEILTRPLVDASPLLSDPAGLRELGDRDGFLWLRALLPVDTVLALRDAVEEFAQRTGWLEDGAVKVPYAFATAFTIRFAACWKFSA